MTRAYINRIATVVPPHDVHTAFASYALSLFERDERRLIAIKRMNPLYRIMRVELMASTIRDFGFDMVLSGKVPAAIKDAIRARSNEILAATPADSIDLWATGGA